MNQLLKTVTLVMSGGKYTEVYALILYPSVCIYSNWFGRGLYPTSPMHVPEQCTRVETLFKRRLKQMAFEMLLA